MLAVLVAACSAFGLLVGSFLNVVIHRVPKGESVVRPRSRCPQCGTELRAVDNVPIVSWLALGRRCRTCGQPISARYPAVELLTGLLFGALAARVGGEWDLPAVLVFAGAFVALSAIDLETYRLPTPIIYVAGVMGGVLFLVAAAATHDWASFLEALIGSAIAFAVLYVIHFVSPRGMGFGDVRLAALVGLLLGWFELPLVGVGLFLGFLLASVVGIGLMVAGRRGRKDRVPFGPFLAGGALLAVFIGEKILDVYLRR